VTCHIQAAPKNSNVALSLRTGPKGLNASRRALSDAMDIIVDRRDLIDGVVAGMGYTKISRYNTYFIHLYTAYHGSCM